MAAFNPNAIKPASKSTEFGSTGNARSARDVLLSGIDSQLKLFKDPKAEGRRWFTVGKSETLLTLRYSNRALVLKDGEAKVVVPNDQVEGAFAHFKAEVEKGTFADQLTTLEKANEGRRDKMRQTRAAKKTS